MRLSIITINYNNAKGLERTIKSVAKQTRRKDLEYIVVDGASNDGSLEVIKQYESQIDKWISEPDKGIYNAMNKGIANATGEYCLFLNSADVFCSPKSIERIINKQWYADVVQCDIFYQSANNKRILRRVFSPDGIAYYQFLKDSLYHQASFIKTSMLKEEGYREDYRLVSDWAYYFKKLIVEGRTYQHIRIPITIFDMDGVSNSGNPLDAAERKDFLLQYFSEQILDKIIKQKEFEHVVESTYMSHQERFLLNLTRRVLSNIFYRLYFYPKMYWDNFKYIEK